MYSDRDILKAIKSRDVKISPFDKKELKPASYCLHLDGKIALAERAFINPTKPQDFSRFYIEGKIKERYILKSGKFILARTVEDIAISKKVAAYVHTRSTLARLGVSVVHDAPIIHPGHGIPKPRKITLEIHNAGPFDLVLKKGMKVAEISFFKLNTPAKAAYDAVGIYGKPKNLDNILPCVQ